MPLVLSVGLTKKVGLPAYSSVGASCNLQLEVDARLLEFDPESLRHQVEEVFTACREAVEEELARHLETGSNDPLVALGGEAGPAGSAGEEASTSSRSASQDSHGNGTPKTNGRQATARQLDFLRLLAGQIDGLGIRRLESFVSDLVGKPLATLSSQDASRIIDALRDVKAGRRILADLANEAEG